MGVIWGIGRDMAKDSGLKGSCCKIWKKALLPASALAHFFGVCPAGPYLGSITGKMFAVAG